MTGEGRIEGWINFISLPTVTKTKNLNLLIRIIAYLKEMAGNVMVQQAERKKEGAYHYTDPDLIPEDTECILVLGGDGTLLQATEMCVYREIPRAWNQSGNTGISCRSGQTFRVSCTGSAYGDDYEIEDR